MSRLKAKKRNWRVASSGGAVGRDVVDAVVRREWVGTEDARKKKRPAWRWV
jgi:hypothetical protein